MREKASFREKVSLKMIKWLSKIKVSYGSERIVLTMDSHVYLLRYWLG